MKKYHTHHEELLRHYQCWLSGFTKLAVCQGMCHPFIKNSHQLMVADIRFPDTDSVPAVIPTCLYRLIHGKMLPEPLSVQSDMNGSLEIDNHLLRYHPMLEGILLNVYVRIGQCSFSNKLISLFNQVSITLSYVPN